MSASLNYNGRPPNLQKCRLTLGLFFEVKFMVMYNFLVVYSFYGRVNCNKAAPDFIIIFFFFLLGAETRGPKRGGRNAQGPKRGGRNAQGPKRGGRNAQGPKRGGRNALHSKLILMN